MSMGNVPPSPDEDERLALARRVIDVARRILGSEPPEYMGSQDVLVVGTDIDEFVTALRAWDAIEDGEV